MNLETGKVLKNSIDCNGYYYVNLGRGNMRRVHRLIAQAFIPNQLNLPQVDHVDENKGNNDVSNLRWVTASQNTRHSAHKHSYRINQLTLDGELLNTWESSIQIERELGYSNSYIIAVCKNKFKQAYGYKWEYADISQQRKFNHPVAVINKDGEYVAEYKNAAEASRCLKICSQSIYYCLNGRYKSTHGLRFIYIN